MSSTTPAEFQPTFTAVNWPSQKQPGRLQVTERATTIDGALLVTVSGTNAVAPLQVDGELILSLFPNIGMLDKGFERMGFCVVRGPDLIFGGDIRNFHPPHGKFSGLIGG